MKKYDELKTRDQLPVADGEELSDGRHMAAGVIVIGAGITGLAVAAHLRTLLRDTVSLTVVEASADVGGMLRSSSLGGHPFDPAADAIAAGADEFRSLLRQCGVDLPVTLPRGAPQEVTMKRGVLRLGARRDAIPRSVVGIEGGVWRLPVALASAVGSIRCGVQATSVMPRGVGWTVGLHDRSRLYADFVVLATPPHVTTAIVQHGFPLLARALSGIRMQPRQSVLIAYRRADVPAERSSGFLASPGVRAWTGMTGCTWLDVKWPDTVAGTDLAVARLVYENPVGGWAESELIDNARRTLYELWGIAQTPLATTVTAWESALPQSSLDPTGLPKRPGLVLTDSAWGRTGIGEHLRSACSVADVIATEAFATRV